MTVELADPASVVIERRVEWPDTDAAGHQPHSVVMRWVEEAEAALLERLGSRGCSGGRRGCATRPTTKPGCGSATGSRSSLLLRASGEPR